MLVLVQGILLMLVGRQLILADVYRMSGTTHVRWETERGSFPDLSDSRRIKEIHHGGNSASRRHQRLPVSWRHV